jgi:CMP/dCMP kinase
MSRKPVVAIDGPAGSGKSTVARKLARRLSFTHIDTGALYRGVALIALRAKIPLTDEVAIAAEVSRAKLEFRQLEEGNLLHINDENVSKLIRTEEISQASSKVSAFPKVRAILLGLQQELGRNGAVVLEGRDIGTVVFPNAEVKIFLTASIEARAKRRTVELSVKGLAVDIDRVLAEMAQRDKQDSERSISPLKQAPDAVVVDTSSMSIESVLDHLESIVRNK